MRFTDVNAVLRTDEDWDLYLLDPLWKLLKRRDWRPHRKHGATCFDTHNVCSKVRNNDVMFLNIDVL